MTQQIKTPDEKINLILESPKRACDLATELKIHASTISKYRRKYHYKIDDNGNVTNTKNFNKISNDFFSRALV